MAAPVKVTQLDSSLLDTEYHNILLSQLVGLTHHRPVFKKLLEVGVVLVYHVSTLWRDTQTPGNEVHNVRYEVKSGSGRTVQLLLHMFFLIFPKLISGIERFAVIENVWNLLNLVNFAVFLRTGKYPILADRIAALPLVTANPESTRTINFSYTNRYVLVSSLLGLLRAIIPYLRLDTLFSFLAAEEMFGSGKERTCAVCRSEHVVCPVRYSTCRHVSCYYCQVTRNSAECPTCSNS